MVQTTTRVLTREGAFVRCLVSPRPGASVKLRLYLSGSPPLDVQGHVRERPANGDPGCWVDFDGLNRADQDLIAKAAAPPVMERVQRAPPAPDSPPLVPDPPRDPMLDLRATERVPANLRIHFNDVDDLVQEFATNISAGGMFVRTDVPPPLHEVVTVTIELPGAAGCIQCRAAIVHRVTREEARLTRRIAGAGVQFVDADDRFREKIDAYIARAQGLTPL